MSLKKLKNRLKAEGVKFDILCALPEGTTLRVGKDLDGVLMWFPEDHVLPEGVTVFISPDDSYTYEALSRIVPNRRDWHCLVNGIDKKTFAASVAFAIAMEAAIGGGQTHGMQG